MELTIQEKIYKQLEFLDINEAYAVSKFLNSNGYANLTVCPECRVDDFVHVEGCKLGKIDIESED